MKLDDMGFYTLTEKRCAEASVFSRLSRCELVLSSKCNFNCPDPSEEERYETCEGAINP